MAKNTHHTSTTNGKELFVTPSGLTHAAPSLANKDITVFNQRIDRGIQKSSEVSAPGGERKPGSLLSKFDYKGSGKK